MSCSVKSTHACVAEVGDEGVAFCSRADVGLERGGLCADHRRAVLHDGCTAGRWETCAVCGES
ncbi:hypothetical protein ABTF68_23120, partial [Acinetobacter baumannii]